MSTRIKSGMKTLLITGIGGDIAQCAATIARTVLPHLRLVGADIHAEHGGVLFVDALHLLPRAHTEEYLPALTRLIADQAIDAILPMSEAELDRLSRSGVLPVAPDRRWLYCGARGLELGLDKLKAAQFVAALGWPTPWTLSADGALPDSYPCIFKARHGAGSKHLAVCADRDDAIFLQKRHGTNGVFQELLLPADQEVTCAVYRALAGDEVRVLQLRRRLVGGFTGWAEVIDSPDVLRFCTDIARAVDLRGCLNVQLILTARGPMLLEINARISSTALMRHKMGFCDVAWLLYEAGGQPLPSYTAPAVGTVAVRIQDAAIITAGAVS